ncbi:MAG: thiamine ABC transporter substrate-binding protein [Anaerolineae bacterium]|nr:thiamine ABC transporter substrate-binding protein [Anaerolineae bacterium]
MKRYILLSVLVALTLAACTSPTPAGPRTLRVMAYSSFSVSDEVVAEFEQAHNATIQFLDAGDTGKMLNQAILSKDNPQADVLYGIDNTFLSRALQEDLFVAYKPEALTGIPAEYQLDPNGAVTPVDFGDVCLNYDKAYFAGHNLAVPQNLKDLANPEYKSLLVVENPASSSPGLAFLLITIAAFGEDRYLDYWADLHENDVRVVEDWDTAYYGEFSGGAYSEGVRPIVVSYATSPAAEVYFSEGALTEPPTGAILTPGTCFRQIEFAGILKNGQNRDLAEAFIEFLASKTFQEDIPLQMWVYPANSQAQLPQVFKDFAAQAQDPAVVAADAIERNREAWIHAWEDTVLK